jgi:hypothetical protein
MAGGVREVSHDQLGPWIFYRAHPANAGEALGFLESGLDVRNADIEHRVTRVACPAADAAWDSRAVVRGIARYEPVIPRFRNCIGNRSARIELPIEQTTVEVAELR